MSTEITWIESNSNKHPIVLYKYRTYRLKEKNNDESSRFYCAKKNNFKCTAHLKVKNSSLNAVTGDHFCQSLDDADVKCLNAEQELKKMVTSDVSKPIRECYNEIQSKLLESGISPDILAAKFPSFAKLTSTLQKRLRQGPRFHEIELISFMRCVKHRKTIVYLIFVYHILMSSLYERCKKPPWKSLTYAIVFPRSILQPHNPKYIFGTGNKYHLAHVKKFLTYTACFKVVFRVLDHSILIFSKNNAGSRIKF
ncbi:hypothetical protein BpHYR1_015884 [Brachionus plicatilis]|uniref:FLYWCH-type domain-containing protein n=1 Tax=Brachionus plicatilis TaxID=10195 RepID=A0A3M7QW77_BRAPC|nr:hypothetical protein BpHYR1_015884 [Brachionus plicatilis]